jgi:uncharacterized glyoxalase superfamily protein PhnB
MADEKPQSAVINTSTHGILKRTTFVVPNAEEAAAYYMHVFGWTKWYDNEVAVHEMFPPAAAPDAPAHLILLRVEDPQIGMLGLLQYKDPPFDTGVKKNRTKVGIGDTLLVVETTDIQGVYERAKEAGANIVAPPTDWEVPGFNGGPPILLTTMSMFDINGIYMEVNAKR